MSVVSAMYNRARLKLMQGQLPLTANVRMALTRGHNPNAEDDEFWTAVSYAEIAPCENYPANGWLVSSQITGSGGVKTWHGKQSFQAPKDEFDCAVLYLDQGSQPLIAYMVFNCGESGPQILQELTLRDINVSWDIIIDARAPHVLKPQIVSPESGDDEVWQNTPIESSAFAVSRGQDTHVQSEFELWRAGTMVWTSGPVQTGLLSQVPDPGSIVAFEVHQTRVRQKGRFLGWSEWSDFVDFTYVEAAVLAPQVEYPATSVGRCSLRPTIQLSDFATTVTGEAHTQNRVQIREQGSETILIDHTYAAGETFRIALEDALNPDFDYEIRAMQEGESLGWSEWSEWEGFQTGYTNKPSIVYPADGADDMLMPFTAASNSMTFTGVELAAHARSRWQTRYDEDIVFDSGEATSNKTSLEIDYEKIHTPDILSNEIRVQYKTTQYGWSEWSDWVAFNLDDRIEKPIITSPSSGATTSDSTLIATGASYNISTTNAVQAQWEFLDNDTDLLVHDTGLVAQSPHNEYTMDFGPWDEHTYKVRVRYWLPEIGYSPWSDLITFTWSE